MWTSLADVVAAGFLAYVWVILVLRLYGKRTLAKLNAFDFIVTVALGSMLATVMLIRDVTILQGAAAFTLLATLQWFVATPTIRVDWAMKAVRSSPRLLLYRGRMLEEAMKAERIAPSDLRAAARSQGHGKLDELFAIVLETDGTLSVLVEEGKLTGMQDVEGYSAERCSEVSLPVVVRPGTSPRPPVRHP